MGPIAHRRFRGRRRTAIIIFKFMVASRGESFPPPSPRTLVRLLSLYQPLVLWLWDCRFKMFLNRMQERHPSYALSPEILIRRVRQ